MNSVLESDLSFTNEYPSLIRRIKSIAIDAGIIIASMLVLSGLIGVSEESPTWIKIVSTIVLFGAYEPIMISLGGTIGNRIMKLQVRRVDDESKNINIIQSYIPFAVKFILGLVSFVTIHMNKKKRALHDIAAGSVMVERRG